MSFSSDFLLQVVGVVSVSGTHRGRDAGLPALVAPGADVWLGDLRLVVPVLVPCVATHGRQQGAGVTQRHRAT